MFAWFKAANVGTSAYPFLTMGNARLLLAHGSQEQIDTYVRPELEGRWFGTMALSEPQAGSSLADITTRAEPQDDGTYRLTGNKMWISGGDHELTENIVHLVLAKIPGGPPGVKGISLFVVPKFLVNEDGSLGERNDVVLAGLNHKMGYRGTTNTLLNFGEGVHRPGGRAGAVGYLVGEQHRGLTYMFHMMNEARIGVGMGAAVLGYTGYLHALDYARTRTQGRPAGAKDPTSPPVPIIEHPDVRRMLLAAKSYAEGGLALGLYCARLVDEEQTAETEDGARPGAPAAGDAHADREGLALAVGTGRRRPRHPGARRLRLHPRLPGRAVLPRQPAQPDPRGHAGHPVARPARPQGRHAGRRRAARCSARRSAPPPRRAAGTEWAGFAADLDAALARLGAVTATLWGAGDPAVTLANSARLPGGGRAPRRRAGCGWSRRSRPVATRATSTRASGRPRGSSGSGSCRRCTTSSTCWSRWTARCWTRAPDWF